MTDGLDAYTDLVSVMEIAAELGVSEFRVRRWIGQRDTTLCPTPVRQLSIGNVYSLAEWRAWWRLWKVTRAPTA